MYNRLSRTLPPALVMKFPFHLIVEYAHTKPAEFTSALNQFFEGQYPEAQKEEENVFALFHEWLIYDYRQSSGVSFFHEYVLKDPDNLSEKTMNHFRKIAETQLYTHLEIQEVKPGAWVKVEDIYTGKIYKVHDVSGSQTLQGRGLFHARLARVDGRWYFVGANPILFPITYTDRAKAIFRKEFKNSSVSPKDTAQLVRDHARQPKPSIPDVPTPKQLKNKRKQLRLLFSKKATKYHSALTFNEVAKAIYEEDHTNLLDFWKELAEKGLGEKFVVEETQLLQEMWNWLPHQSLGGKSPIEMLTELHEANKG